MCENHDYPDQNRDSHVNKKNKFSQRKLRENHGSPDQNRDSRVNKKNKFSRRKSRENDDSRVVFLANFWLEIAQEIRKLTIFNKRFEMVCRIPKQLSVFFNRLLSPFG